VNQAFKLNRFVKHITLAPRGYKPRGFWLISWDFFLHLKCYKRKPNFFSSVTLYLLINIDSKAYPYRIDKHLALPLIL